MTGRKGSWRRVRRAQLHPTGFEIKFRAGSNPIGGVFEICDDENL